MRLSNSILMALSISLLLASSVSEFSACSVDSGTHECRLWGATADSVPTSVVKDHLVSMQYSLKNLGAYNRNGWALAYFNKTLSKPVTHRGRLPANMDPAFDEAVNEIADNEPQTIVGHVRIATSGLVDIPDPHPFNRSKNGKWWLFAHNGGVSKSITIELMGNEYLNENLPQVGNGPDEWVDSELYFLYVLKCIEDQGWNVTLGITQAITTICEKNNYAVMNFLLTNGEHLWGFCKGYGLHYRYTSTSETTPQWTVIASQPPTSTYEGWALLDDFDLLEASKNKPPVILDVRSIVIPEHSVPRLAGDVSNDERVDLRDLFIVCKAFGATPSRPNWDLRADIAKPYNLVDTRDLIIVLQNFGQPEA